MAAKNRSKQQGVIFRRYIRRKDGSLDDAMAHGLRAWPIRVNGDKRPKTA
jgi:hypothetical protein